MKKAGNQLPKQLKCYHCGRNNHAMKNVFAFHPEKRPTSEREKAIEAKIGALKEKFKSLVSSDQILDSPSTSGTKASSSTPYYYMSGASEQVVSSAAVRRVQTVSRATPPTTRKSMDNLRDRVMVPRIRLAKYVFHCLLDWQMLPNLSMVVIQFWRLRIRRTTWCIFWHPKCYTHFCSQQCSGLHPISNQLRYIT